MGSVLASTILDRAQVSLLEDGAGTYWTRTTLFDALNEGTQAITAERPDQYVLNGALPLVGGVKQILPDNAIVLVNMTRNMGSMGMMPGRAIRQTDLDVMTRVRADWMIDPADPVVENFMYDKRDPRRFYVWPPQPTPGDFVDMVYTASTPVLAVETQAIVVDDTLQTPLYWFVLARAYEKNATRGDTVKSNYYLQLFNQALGLEVSGRNIVEADIEKA